MYKISLSIKAVDCKNTALRAYGLGQLGPSDSHRKEAVSFCYCEPLIYRVSLGLHFKLILRPLLPARTINKE